jgi:hypothetical protein
MRDIGSFIGALSNLSRLCPRWPWLAWLCEAPSIVRGVIQGVLPPVLLAVLNLLLPIILRRERWWWVILHIFRQAAHARSPNFA